MHPVTHLHFHSEYSFLDSLIRIEQLSELCEKKGIQAIALTDHGNVDGIIKFYQALEKTKTIPLLGCELYVVDDLNQKSDKKRYHITCIAKSRKGFGSLMKCLTVANLEGFYYRPRTDWAHLVEMEDVVIMTACMDGPFSHPRSDELITKLAERFGEDFYVEMMLLADYSPQVARNKLAFAVATERGLKFAFTTDVHYAERDDWRDREIQRAMSHREKITDVRQLDAGTKSLWLKTYDDMVLGLKAFGLEDREQAMAETWDEIVDKCAFKLEQLSVTVPVAYEASRSDPGEYLRNLCREALANNDNLKSDEVARVRMEHELDEIIELGFAEYFLLVQDMVLKARESGIQDGIGRGSVGGSLTAFLLDITGVNPLDYGLAFERFISPGRHDLPDIDLDFEDVKRDGILKYMTQKYGDHNVAQVSTFSTSHGRGAVRDVSRVYGVPLAEVDAVAKQIVVRCLDGESEIYTAEGPAKIRDLVGRKNFRIAAQSVFKRQTRIVKEVFESGSKDMFEMELESGKKVICSVEHRFWVSSDKAFPVTGEDGRVVNRKTGWKRLSEINIEHDRVLTCDKEEAYFKCKQCGKLKYKWRKEERDFCSLSCLVTYRDLHNNPMENAETRAKMRKTKKGVLAGGKSPMWNSVLKKKASKRWKGIHNPMKNPKTAEKQRQSLLKVMSEVNRRPEKRRAQSEYMRDKLDKDPDSHPLRILAKNHKKGICTISYPQFVLSRIVKKIFGKDAVEDEFVIVRSDLCEKGSRRRYYLDVAVPKHKLDFEYDGSLHKDMVEQDRERDAHLSSAGWKVIRFKKQDLHDLEVLVQDVADAI